MRVGVGFGAFPLPFNSVGLLRVVHTPIRPAGAGPFDQCDQRGRGSLEAAPNLRRRTRGIVWSRLGLRAAAARSKLVLKKNCSPRTSFLFLFCVFQIVKPSCSWVSRPVRIRHRSTANCGPGRRWLFCGRLRWPGRLWPGSLSICTPACNWAGSGPVARPVPPAPRASAGLPCLVTQLCKRLLATGVFARTKTGVTGDLAAIVETAPIANLPIDDHAGHLPQSARLVGQRQRFAVAA